MVAPLDAVQSASLTALEPNDSPSDPNREPTFTQRLTTNLASGMAEFFGQENLGRFIQEEARSRQRERQRAELGRAIASARSLASEGNISGAQAVLNRFIEVGAPSPKVAAFATQFGRQLQEESDEVKAREEQGLVLQRFQESLDNLVSPGRPLVRNPDGSTSTQALITITDPRIGGGAPTNIPTIFRGQRVAPEIAIELIANAKGIDPETGRAVESFESLEEAETAARRQSAALGQRLQRAELTSSAAEAALATGQRFNFAEAIKPFFASGEKPLTRPKDITFKFLTEQKGLPPDVALQTLEQLTSSVRAKDFGQAAELLSQVTHGKSVGALLSEGAEGREKVQNLRQQLVEEKVEQNAALAGAQPLPNGFMTNFETIQKLADTLNAVGEIIGKVGPENMGKLVGLARGKSFPLRSLLASAGFDLTTEDERALNTLTTRIFLEEAKRISGVAVRDVERKLIQRTVLNTGGSAEQFLTNFKVLSQAVFPIQDRMIALANARRNNLEDFRIAPFLDPETLTSGTAPTPETPPPTPEVGQSTSLPSPTTPPTLENVQNAVDLTSLREVAGRVRAMPPSPERNALIDAIVERAKTIESTLGGQ